MPPATSLELKTSKSENTQIPEATIPKLETPSPEALDPFSLNLKALDPRIQALNDWNRVPLRACFRAPYQVSGFGYNVGSS